MDIAALRAQTPGCASRIHLNNAGAALLAQPTIDAMTSHLRLETEIGGYEAATWDGHRGFTWAAGARRFASWEHSYVNVLGLGAAVQQALDLGLDAIGRRCAALGARLRDQLGDLPGVSTHDLGQTRCAIVTAKIGGMPATAAAAALRQAGVNVTTTVPEDNQLDTEIRPVHPLVRFSPHYYNTEAEIDRATQLVAALTG